MNDYAKALEYHNAAYLAFNQVTEDYRRRIIGDAAFDVARKLYDNAGAFFDAACEAERVVTQSKLA